MPWNPNASGFWETTKAYGRAGKRAVVGTTSGAVAGAGTGAATGAAVGAGVGVCAGGVGAGPGALAGAGAGAVGGGAWGGVSGLIGAAFAEEGQGTLETAKKGAIQGGIGGAFGGAGRAYGAVKALTAAEQAAAAAAAATNRVLPQLGSKLEYIFGRATGSAHNIERSKAMLAQMERIGLQDCAASRTVVQEHLGSVINNASNIVRTQANGYVVRESLLMGPNGAVKVESIWDGTKLITVKLFGG